MLMIVLEVAAVLIIFWFINITISSFIGIPCLPTHRAQARKMIELARIQPGQTVIDLGAGHGRLLFLAAEAGAEAIGYELNPILVLYIKIRALLSRQKKVRVYWRSLYKADVSRADTVFCFLFESYMRQVEEKLFAEMRPGAKIIAYVFSFPNKKFVLKTEGVRVYEVGSEMESKTGAVH
jgi:SAM-dependent methyltransferase